jgi:peptidoglycan/LPS O-acetylase OafA/YrhL
MQLKSVQALRAFAALAVVMCHLRALEGKYLSSTLPNGEIDLSTVILQPFWENGAGGVDLFFVISGFIMVWVAGETQRTARGGAQFLFARATRIYPLWWLFAATMAAYFFVTYGVPWDAERLAKEGVTGTEHLIKSALLVPQNGHPVLGVGWTLVHEMYFYLGFALLIFCIPARFRIYGIIFWGIAVIAGSLLGLSDKTAKTFVELIFYPMTLQFIMGALVAYAIKAGYRRFAWLTTLLGLTGLVVVFFTLDFKSGGILLAQLNLADPSQFTLGWGRTLLFGIPAALLIHGLVSLELEHGLGRCIPKLMVSIGDWSYALYLGHLIVIPAFGRIVFNRLSADGLIDNAAFIVVGVVGSVVAAALTYVLFEKPLIGVFRTLRRTLFGRAVPQGTIPEKTAP